MKKPEYLVFGSFHYGVCIKNTRAICLFATWILGVVKYLVALRGKAHILNHVKGKKRGWSVRHYKIISFKTFAEACRYRFQYLEKDQCKRSGYPCRSDGCPYWKNPKLTISTKGLTDFITKRRL